MEHSLWSWFFVYNEYLQVTWKWLRIFLRTVSTQRPVHSDPTLSVASIPVQKWASWDEDLSLSLKKSHLTPTTHKLHLCNKGNWRVTHVGHIFDTDSVYCSPWCDNQNLLPTYPKEWADMLLVKCRPWFLLTSTDLEHEWHGITKYASLILTKHINRWVLGSWKSGLDLESIAHSKLSRTMPLYHGCGLEEGLMTNATSFGLRTPVIKSSQVASWPPVLNLQSKKWFVFLQPKKKMVMKVTDPSKAYKSCWIPLILILLRQSCTECAVQLYKKTYLESNHVVRANLRWLLWFSTKQFCQDVGTLSA